MRRGQIEAVAALVDPRHLGAGADLDAALAQLLREPDAEIVVEALEQLLAADDEADFRAKAMSFKVILMNRKIILRYLF